MKRNFVHKKTEKKVYVKPIKDKKRDIFLAYFLKYGYWASMCLSLTFWGTENNQFLIFAMAIVIHGIWSLLASIKPARHLVIAMLEGKSQGFHKYEHTHSYEKIREIQNETRKIAIGFIVLGMVMIFINII